MTSIGSPPNVLSAPSAALTTPACEHDESTLTPRPRTRAARKRSSRIKGSGTACPSRTVWCPTHPASYDVTRSISPLTKKKPASVWASACFVTRPPAPPRRLERRLRVQQHQRTGRGHDATLVGPVWV